MIVHLKTTIGHDEARTLAQEHQAILTQNTQWHTGYILTLSSKVKELPAELSQHTEDFVVLDSDIQFASRSYQDRKAEVRIAEDLVVGGEGNSTWLMTGPCSVESKEQIETIAALCKTQDVRIIRGGCYKPRTSPYSFQGLGLEGLRILREVADANDLKVITEVRDASHVQDVIQHADIIQIGAKAMYDHGILRACGQQSKPVLLKRGFNSTLQEFVQAAEFILSLGNPNVILCERGIRTFEKATRFTLDLCGVSWLKEYCNLPIVVDPSHAIGYRFGVADLSRAAFAMGIDGLLIECHPNPAEAKSDAAQQITPEMFSELAASLRKMAPGIGRRLK